MSNKGKHNSLTSAHLATDRENPWNKFGVKLKDCSNNINIQTGLIQAVLTFVVRISTALGLDKTNKT
jgi:hypothetical protein